MKEVAVKKQVGSKREPERKSTRKSIPVIELPVKKRDKKSTPVPVKEAEDDLPPFIQKKKQKKWK